MLYCQQIQSTYVTMFNMLASAKLGLLCALYGMNIWYFCEVCMSPAYPQRKLGAIEHQTTYINDAFQFLSWTTTCICTPYNMWSLYCNVVFCACGHLCFCFWFYIIVPLLWGDQLLVLFLWAWYTGPDHEMCGSLHPVLAVQCSQCTISHLLVSEPDPHTC